MGGGTAYNVVGRDVGKGLNDVLFDEEGVDKLLVAGLDLVIGRRGGQALAELGLGRGERREQRDHQRDETHGGRSGAMVRWRGGGRLRKREEGLRGDSYLLRHALIRNVQVVCRELDISASAGNIRGPISGGG